METNVHFNYKTKEVIRSKELTDYSYELRKHVLRVLYTNVIIPKFNIDMWSYQ